MKQEFKIGILALLLIAAGGATIKYGKLRMGKPGLVIEAGSLTNELGVVVRTNRVHFSKDLPTYRSSDTAISDWEVRTLPKDTTFGRQVYWNNEGFGATMTAVVMGTDRTSIHRPQVCVTGQGWTIDKTDVIDIPIASPHPYTLSATCLTVSKEVIDKNKEKRVAHAIYIYWFVSEHYLARTHPEAIWHITRDLAMTGTLSPWAYVSCFATCAPGSEELLLARMKRLIAAATPEFQTTVPPRSEKQTASLEKSVVLQ